MIRDNIYIKRMIAKQLQALHDLVISKTYYKLGANYCHYSIVDPKNGFDCASSAMYGLEKAFNHELLCGNQNVIENEAKKKDGLFRYSLSPKPGNLCIVNYPTGHKYDMGAYSYNGFYYPDPADHVFTIGYDNLTIDTGYDDKQATVIKFGELDKSIEMYQSLGARLVYLEPRYLQIRDKIKQGVI